MIIKNFGQRVTLNGLVNTGNFQSLNTWLSCKSMSVMVQKVAGLNPDLTSRRKENCQPTQQ